MGRPEVHIDTHVAVWLYSNPGRDWPVRARDSLNRGLIRYSPMVRFELGLLHQIGRLTVAPSEMLGQLSLRLGMRELTQPLSALIDVADMITWTRDPFDRLIVAGAQLADATLVTKDHAIRTHFRGAVWD